MICLQRREGWDISFQRSHAAMAAQILYHWRGDDRPPGWEHLLMACAQHDNGWTEWEPGGRLSETGAPIDFRHAYLEHILIQAKRVVALAWHQDATVGWLISRHMHHLYDPRRAELAELDAWLEAECAQRERRREITGLTTQELEHAYALLLFCDTLSLTLCEEAMPFDQRQLEIGRLPSGQLGHAVDMGDSEIRLWPWPFDASCTQLQIHAERYLVDRLTFPDHDTFLEHVQATPPERVCWTLRPAQSPDLGSSPLDAMTRDRLFELCQDASLGPLTRHTKPELVALYSAHLAHTAYVCST